LDTGRNKIDISVVIPAYKCENCISELYDQLLKTLEKLCNSYEIIFVNDASPEKDWEIIRGLAEKDKKVRGINFSRNFGQHSAITAGIDESHGEWTVVMDCDLQDRPEEIEKLYSKAKEGYDIVYARRAERKDGFLKKLTSRLFYAALSYLTDTKQDETVANFGIYSRKAVQAVQSLKDNLRYFPVRIRWIGFSSASVDVEHRPNSERKSSYSFRKLLSLALDVMLATSNKPLKLVVELGMMISAGSFAFAVYLLIRALSGDYLIAGWPSLIVSIWFLSGIIILILGIIGLYVGKTFDETKKKPLYIIKEIIGNDR